MPRGSACLTCRSRKVKCDRSFGRCSTCSRLNRQCTTFKVPPLTITWLPFEVGGGELSPNEAVQFDSRQHQPGAKGRLLQSEADRARDVNIMLNSVWDKSVEQVQGHLDARSDSLDADETMALGPFSIFRSAKLTESTSPAVSPRAAPEMDSPGDQDVDMSSLYCGGSELIDATSLSQPTQLSELFSYNLLDCDPNPNFCPYSISTDQEIGPISLGEIFPVDVASLALPPLMPLTYEADIHDLDFPTTRLLLSRYQDVLSPYFAPIKAYYSFPWKTLHVPTVHETLGEVSTWGSSSNSKVSLLFAVLSASSFHLDNLGASLGEGTDLSWKGIAIRFRERAKLRLKKSLRGFSQGQEREDYKHVLLALLSMVTICVVSGEMHDAPVYLRDIEHLIAIQGVNEMQGSDGLPMLHSTFLYLRTLQVGMRFNARRARERTTNEKRQSGHGSLIGDHNASLWSSFPGTGFGRRPAAPPCHICGKNKTAFEQIYSLSGSLFYFIARVTKITRAIAASKNSPEARMNHGSLSKDISQLETAICNWKNDIPNPGQDEGTIPHCSDCAPRNSLNATRKCSENRDRLALLHHLGEAMHAALLTYFYRCVKNIDVKLLQRFVDKTVVNLIKYSKLKRKLNDPSSNLCWPGFIAGCEALDPKTRMTICAWFSSEAASTGIKMFDVAGRVVEEVWAARDLANDPNLSWSKILSESHRLDGLVLS